MKNWFCYRHPLGLCVAMALLSGCGGLQPPIGGLGAVPQTMLRDDGTSILKRLTKDIVIGTTVDPTNGDKAARAISVVPITYGKLKRGELLTCNFDNKDGVAGKGTTIDVFASRAGAEPATFADSAKIEGCDGSVSAQAAVYATGATSHLLVSIAPSGEVSKSGLDLGLPFSVAYAVPKTEYTPAYVYVSDAKTGAIFKMSEGFYGNGEALQVATGFAVNHKPAWGKLGPSGLQYDARTDVLYIADGSTNTVVEFTNASKLDMKDEIIVEPSGKRFKCKDPLATCGKLVYAGHPVDAPEAMTILPNGNLIVANTMGGNTLVEIDTSDGRVLDTKVVDNSKAAGIFGLAATGTNDKNTALYYTDTNSNSVQELEQ